MKGNKAFVNEFDLSEKVKSFIRNNHVVPRVKDLGIYEFSRKYEGILSDSELELLLDEINKQKWIPVGKDGILKNYKEGDEIGSYRLSCYEPELAEVIWNRIKESLPKVRVMKEDSPTDWGGYKEWEPIGINPLFRFIRYTDKGFLVPHYDWSYVQDENVRSLSTLVIYLEGTGTGGATRFLRDEQVNIPLKDWDLSDWTVEASEDLVLKKVHGHPGEAILFDHWVLHDSERIFGGQKTIIRTDVMYRMK